MPDPGIYDDNGPSGCPGKAIVGSGGFLLDVIVNESLDDQKMKMSKFVHKI